MEDTIMKHIALKKGTPKRIYTAFCNKAERDGVFVACGSVENMWIKVRFQNKIDMMAWLSALAM